MTGEPRSPTVLRSHRREGAARRSTPTGEVGRVFRGAGLEVVWIRKHGEVIDQDWFSMPSVDILIVVKGRLRVEFSRARRRPRVLGVGDILVLPPRTRCRAYRWPRSSRGATIFVAVYPARGPGNRSYVRSRPIKRGARDRARSA